ncbi:MAG: helix-turn-helix domain-containing protein [Chitinophagaceae bacterium]|jgi:AraC-like DNA-binding protein
MSSVNKGHYVQALEKITPDENSSFHLMVNPRLHDFFFWHFHPEIELVFLDGADGTRHVGDHLSAFYKSDLVMIGPYIPHLNFDYGIQTDYEKTVLHLQEDFLKDLLERTPELQEIGKLFQDVAHGIVFGEVVKEEVGPRLKKLNQLSGFAQFLEVLHILHLLATTTDKQLLHEIPYQNRVHKKEQERLRKIYDLIDARYRERITIDEAASSANLGKEAFCRYFRKMTRLSFIEFLNLYRVNQSKRMLRLGKSITEACYSSGFESLSYFNRVFKKQSGETPSAFRRRFVSN